MATFIILFDGVCNLCDGAVNFIIDRDEKNIFRFASLQSEAGKEWLQKTGLAHTGIDSIVLIKDGRAFVKSEAALEIARHLKGGWPLLRVFKILPKSLRDSAYDLIARNRYRWFGKQEQCRVPTPELKERFL
jgi:predicted DCC family thiol-disulfide oxidoreductase YuxK